MTLQELLSSLGACREAHGYAFFLTRDGWL